MQDLIASNKALPMVTMVGRLIVAIAYEGIGRHSRGGTA